MNEEKTIEMEQEVNDIPKKEKKTKKRKEKAPKKPFRQRLGEHLLSDEPLIPKKVIRGVAAGTILAAGGVIVAKVFGGDGGEILEALPEGTVDALPEAIDDAPFEVLTETMDTVE